MKRSGIVFQTVKTEGAILPADLLRRLVEGDRDVAGLRSEDYHLAKSERLNEAATRGWNRVQGAWEGFKSACETLPESDAGTTLTRERWLLILFQELGYGRLTTRRAYEVEGKSYPISHEWQNTPIHLVSFRLDLDKRTPGRAGAARVSPHSLVQEFLNRSDDHLWGFVSNGLNLRLLRDNVSLTRQAYVEFDLQAMMDSEAYSDFFLLYLLCHQSRVEVPEGKTPEHCWLEKWYNTAAQQGVRALDQLRDGVQKAIEALGGGFLAHPANEELREKLRSSALGTQDYYRQVLRQVYRLLFLFVAEDRELLFDPSAPSEARRLYTSYYSTQRLRNLAAKTRGTRHPDLWRSLRLVLGKLHDGCPQLGLPALASFLFSAEATADLNNHDIANTDLLKAIRALAFTVDRNVLRPVNYRNLGPEELGSVYESLLEMHPEIHIQATNPEDRFRLTVAAGSERKTTGSYYTPTSLVNCLLDSALDPVLDEACKKPDPEQALLALKICDPACGSGHFLIAAAHRIAKRLAAIRAGEDEPSPEHYQHALRDCIGHCIYGVDINPMSVELCKVSLWMEAMEPGKPLAFLDHRIQCGNSLFGTTPALLKQGIPEAAFKPIEGDDKEYCKELKKQNKGERKDFERGQQTLFQPWERLGNLATAMMDLDDMPDDTPEALRKKQQRYEQLVKSSGYLFGHLWADAWCAAFVWKKVPERDGGPPYAMTEQVFRAIEKNPHTVPPWMKDEIRRLAQEYRFFHWHLAFPDVFRVPTPEETPENEQTGWSGGFDCVLGNPPWERIKLQEKEFFATRAPEIANARNAAARRRMIARLPETDPALHHAFQEALRHADGESRLVRDTGRYPLCGRGDVNTYSIFAELKRSLLNPSGRVGCIVPSGIATDDTTKFFFQDLMDTGSLVSLCSFENEEFIFPAVHHATKFCLLTMAAPRSELKRTVDFVFFARQAEHLAEKDRHFTLTAADIALLNPNTRTCPIFRHKRDAELTKYIYRRVPVLLNEASAHTPIVPSYRQGLFHSSTDAGTFNNNTLEQLLLRGGNLTGGNKIALPDETYLPLYEAKMVHQFDHRYGTYDGATEANRNAGILPQTLPEQKREPAFAPLPRYWVSEGEVAGRMARFCDNHWVLAFRDITSAVVERTAISVILPAIGISDQFGLLTMQGAPAQASACIVANMNSFVLDYVARQKLGGNHLKKYHVFQLPILPQPAYKWWDMVFTVSRAIELTYTSFDLQSFAEDCGYDGPPFVWDEDRRFMIRAELDAVFFRSYFGNEQEWKQNGSQHLLEYFPTPRHAVAYIMDTFRILREREEAAHGTFKTKDTILEIYDEMAGVMRQNAAAVAAGQQPAARYQTRLDPPPGPPCDAEGNFIPMAQWDRANWPPHIHPPKEAVVEVPAEVPVADFAALAYPANDTERAICAVALAIVEQSGGLASMDHLDALLLAAHPDWCKVFLGQGDHAAFDTARRAAPGALFVDQNQSIRWKDCRDYLEKRDALVVAHGDAGQPIEVGTALATVKATLFGGVDELATWCLKALERVRELRRDDAAATQEQRRLLAVFRQQEQAAGMTAA